MQDGAREQKGGVGDQHHADVAVPRTISGERTLGPGRGGDPEPSSVQAAGGFEAPFAEAQISGRGSFGNAQTGPQALPGRGSFGNPQTGPQALLSGPQQIQTDLRTPAGSDGFINPSSFASPAALAPPPTTPAPAATALKVRPARPRCRPASPLCSLCLPVSMYISVHAQIRVTVLYRHVALRPRMMAPLT